MCRHCKIGLNICVGLTELLGSFRLILRHAWKTSWIALIYIKGSRLTWSITLMSIVLCSFRYSTLALTCPQTSDDGCGNAYVRIISESAWIK
jgi:hypothetical protein